MFLKSAIKKEKATRLYARIWKIKGNYYYLFDVNGNHFEVAITFFNMKEKPQIGDGFYMSENMISGMEENCYGYNFSETIGEQYARKPHDFKKNPREFLIFEYQNGKTILLEQWYG